MESKLNAKKRVQQASWDSRKETQNDEAQVRQMGKNTKKNRRRVNTKRREHKSNNTYKEYKEKKTEILRSRKKRERGKKQKTHSLTNKLK
jgi:hypothetical protein